MKKCEVERNFRAKATVALSVKNLAAEYCQAYGLHTFGLIF
ncbi:hypothetical protein QHH11_16935 [Aphanizomenon sp. PH219]|nr:hypothetical protein [Aphanizomenon sp. 202]MDK2460799.1 hypothetical protein [Aphanizomenon sp. PH219]